MSTPGDHVWDAIAAEVAADHHTHARTTVSASTASSQPHHAPRQRRRTPLALVVSALTAAAAAVAITLVIMIPRPVGIATASLDAFPDHPGARGTAELEREPNGTERVRVELDATVPADGLREVWLLTEDGTALVSLGVLDGSVGSFTLPSTSTRRGIRSSTSPKSRRMAELSTPATRSSGVNSPGRERRGVASGILV
ncbi:anti-sigma factor [uncultured Microbacterium sp.]|uniref:anti-sigma factor domain-containing protein n=1 Tax=uncultured Microbacterium sp. TaxID=191216 RepID=UPI002637DF0C|nr:anti-sigma factor [uncultured Microbacterium sp.]